MDILSRTDLHKLTRVRCDLKDLSISTSGQHPPCSNCSERGLKCVDEFAEVKAVKLLRRGRRLQQVEAVYGQNSGDEDSLHLVNPPRSIIPRLQPEFFSSPFFHRFHIQRPILEPMEFCNRYYAFCKGNKEQLQAPGQLIAMILVVWAASFGVNEYGVEELYDGQVDLRRRRDRVNEMVGEILYLIDIHSILRKPTWDGVRALLLILPLTQGGQFFSLLLRNVADSDAVAEIQPSLERLVRPLTVILVIRSDSGLVTSSLCMKQPLTRCTFYAALHRSPRLIAAKENMWMRWSVPAYFGMHMSSMA